MSRSSRCLTVILAVLLPCSAFAQTKPADVLRELGVELTREGVARFLEAAAKGEHGPGSDREVTDLIARLGHDDFETREKATKQLSLMVFPPVEKIREATKSRDAEVARRAAGILAHLEERIDPLAALFVAARERKVPVALAQIVAVLARCESPAAVEAAQDAIVAGVGAGDLDSVRKWIGDRDGRIRAAAIRALGTIRKADAVAELEKHLEGKDPTARAAAARALVDLGKVLDYKKYASELDAETRVLVLRTAEKRFRQENKDKRDDAKAQDEYQKLLADLVDALPRSKNVVKESKNPQNTQYWLELGMDTSKHPEILMYRIQWFSGAWSPWYVPGFNDKEVGKGRNIRLWGCFNDHTYEIITTTDKSKHREVQDLP